MSGRTYQTLHRYKGSIYGAPQYTGIEYDYEVPDNIVVSSPGGVSSVQHHWTKGFYGNGASTYDVYAGEGNAYPYGELGNLYQQGQNASREMGMFPPGTDQMYTGNQSTAHVENFRSVDSGDTQYASLENLGGRERYSPDQQQIGQTTVPGMELIAPPDAGSSVQVANAARSAVKAEVAEITHKIHFPNPWIVLLMVVLLYLALDFITSAGQSVLFTKFHSGKTPDWRWLTFYALVFLSLAVAIGASFQDPLFALKKFEGEIL